MLQLQNYEACEGGQWISFAKEASRPKSHVPSSLRGTTPEALGNQGGPKAAAAGGKYKKTASMPATAAVKS